MKETEEQEVMHLRREVNDWRERYNEACMERDRLKPEFQARVYVRQELEELLGTKEVGEAAARVKDLQAQVTDLAAAVTELVPYITPGTLQAKLSGATLETIGRYGLKEDRK